MIFYDAHFHLVPSVRTFSAQRKKENLYGIQSDSPQFGKDNGGQKFLTECLDAFFPENAFFCTAAHTQEEFTEQSNLIKNTPLFNRKSSCGLEHFLIQSFGLHPQMPLLENADFLQRLLSEKKISAIGECGFDYFTEEFKANSQNQEKAFDLQVSLAEQYHVPIIIHARKATQKIFEYSGRLKKVPAVVFHSFSGSLMDAHSILNKNINAFFSFGKPVINGAKKAVACVKTLPLDRLLLETDAPYQTLKGERATSPAEIADVYQTAFEIRSILAIKGRKEPLSFGDFCDKIAINFRSAFMNLR